MILPAGASVQAAAEWNTMVSCCAVLDCGSRTAKSRKSAMAAGWVAG